MSLALGSGDAAAFARPLPVQFGGSALARRLLALAGWRVVFDGLPARQGVLVVYPHTSNWDFVVLLLAKWSVGLPLVFWAKDRLFRVPLFGHWLRWLGGVPVDRTAARGVVSQTVDLITQCRIENRYFWLGLAPEGTRRAIAGWRSGFYRTALRAAAPLCLVRLDYARREILANNFLLLSGDEAADFARIAAVYAGVVGAVPANAAPIRLLDPSIPRSDTVMK